MVVEMYRLPSKRGWVATPLTRGRKLNLPDRANSRRVMGEGRTRDEALRALNSALGGRLSRTEATVVNV